MAFVYRHGWILYYGDAEAHLNTARRIIDSRTPGLDQFGSPWLPMLHALLVPFAARDDLWRSGLAGAIPSAICFVIAGSFLFAAAVVAVALFALNPNLLYLQSTPMTEPVFYAALAAILYFTVLFHENQAWWAAAGAGLACLAGTLSRYDGWFLVPAVTLYFLFGARRRRLLTAAAAGAIASIGPLAWLAYNWFWFGDALFFYRGPYSAAAIQGSQPYPGHGDWKLAAIYYRAAVEWCVGPVLRWIGAAGILAGLSRKAFWPLLLLVLPGVFYVWNIHSGAAPIHVPNLWPFSYYNSRYGLVLLPLAALAAAALVTLVPARARGWAAGAFVVACSLPWLLHPAPENWITWKESQVNSAARRAWTRQAADFLAAHYRRGDGIFTEFSDLTAIYRTMGLPLRETLTWDNNPQWLAATKRPDLFLWEGWAVCLGGDPVEAAIKRAFRQGPHYELAGWIAVKDAPVVEIYRRSLQHEGPVR